MASSPPVAVMRVDITGGDAYYDMVPDGERFLVISSGAAGESDTVSRMRLIQNWTEELKRLVPVN